MIVAALEFAQLGWRALSGEVKDMLKIKPVRPEVLTLTASACLLAAFNLPLWQHLGSIALGIRTPLIAAFGLLVAAAFNLVLALLSGRWTLKPSLMFLFPLSAAAAWFMNRYGVMIDAGMFRNVAETDLAEVVDLLSWKFGSYMLLCGIFPALVIYKLPVNYRVGVSGVVSRLLVAVVSAVLMAVIALSNYQGLASLFRNHHELRLLVVPSNVVGATIGYLGEQLASARHPFTTLGIDAHKASIWAAHHRPSLTVLVVGESARADNFSLLGYKRETNPELTRESGLLAFSDVRSCGTETAVSVPCMFSNLGRRNYSAAQAQAREGLLDVLAHAGLKVLWLDNQSGCKGTCARVGYENLSGRQDARYCDHECHDEVLLSGLPALLDSLKEDTVLVVHQMGSHGPDYFKRYPAGYEHFSPVCQSNDLAACSRESIINAYDNSIRYTDHILASLIDTLRSRQGEVDSAMLYLSDHGESLGEYNLFLHGTPYMLAPDQQKHVPLLAWFSDGYQRSFQLDQACLARRQGNAYSQDNLFHSMLGLLQIETSVYSASLDLFAGCRGLTSSQG